MGLIRGLLPTAVAAAALLSGQVGATPSPVQVLVFTGGGATAATTQVLQKRSLLYTRAARERFSAEQRKGQLLPSVRSRAGT